MPKIPQCDRCLYYGHHYSLVCSLHPKGVDVDECPDYTPDPEVAEKRFEDFLGLEWSDGSEYDHLELPINNPFSWEPEENWSPLGTKFVNGELVLESEEVSYYNGEPTPQPRQHWTKEELLEIIDTHPMFTGRCPECEMPYPKDYRPPVHWDCPFCVWKDDSV